MDRGLVGRHAQLQELLGLAEAATHGSFHLVIVEGSAGYGKTFLLTELRTRLRERLSHNNISLRVAAARCSSETGTDNSYGPIDTIISTLGAVPGVVRQGDDLRLGDLESSPTLAEVVRVTDAADSSSSTARDYAVRPSTSQAVSSRLESILSLARPSGLMFIVDDAHFIDAESCRVLSALAHSSLAARLMVILAARPEAAGPASAMSSLIAEVQDRPSMRWIILPPLDGTESAQLYFELTGESLSEEGRIGLVRRTRGEPFAIVNEARIATRSGPKISGRAYADPEESRILVLRERARGLDEEDRLLLRLAATGADFFQSSVLSDAMELEHEALCGKLRRIDSETGLIRRMQPPDWAYGIDSEFFEFEHGYVQDFFSRESSARESSKDHGRMARALDTLAGRLSRQPQNLLPAIARHYRAAGESLEAAQRALDVARVLALRGSEIQHVAAVCHGGIGDLDSLGRSAEASRLRAQLIELELGVTELRWQGGSGRAEKDRIERACDMAIDAAVIVGDESLLARMVLMKGRVLLHTQGVPQSLGLLEQAYELGKGGHDVVTRFTTAVEYGRQLPKKDVEAGIQVLREADELLARRPELSTSRDQFVIRARDLVKLQLGVNLMDNGELGQALDLLIPGVAIARRDRVGLIAIGTNYLAQALLSVGDADEAVRRLSEVTRTEIQGEQGDAWHANNLALLGHALAAYHSEQSALGHLETAWFETERSWLANLVPIVGNLYAESLMYLGEPNQEQLSRAKAILDTCTEETDRSQMIRSKIKTLSLLSEYWWRLGETVISRTRSSEAIELLRDRNWRMPALRAEDILIQHATIFRRLGNLDDAADYASRAQGEVRRKFRTLPERYKQHWDSELVNRKVMQLCSELGV